MKKHFLLLTLMCSMVAMTFGQSRRISGQVLNSETNEAIAGASVSEKATNGTVTDASGHFSLNIPSVSNVTLIISHTGYSPQQVVVENQVDLVIKIGQYSLSIG